jgi:hypothetical protein
MNNVSKWMPMVHNTETPPVSLWPDFDFRRLPLCNTSCKQLGGIYERVRAGTVPKAKTKLLQLLLASVYDERRGSYIPFSDDVYLAGRGPVYSEALHSSWGAFHKEPFRFQFFMNALQIAPRYGTDAFDPNQIAAPKLRVTNTGFLVVTLEMDCETLQEFEQNLA